MTPRVRFIFLCSLVVALNAHAEPRRLASDGVRSAQRDAEASHVEGSSETADARVLVVLVGSVGDESELTGTLTELLEREGVTPEFERRPQFRASALLSESAGDGRVWVFVTKNGTHEARLYFRGPSGERFLLRRLALKNGFDELGRELVAQVVETSTLALLRSEAGISREEARAGLTEEEAPSDTPEPPKPTVPVKPRLVPKPALRVLRRPFDLGFGARGTASYAGKAFGLDHGVGVEATFGGRLAPSLFWRGRGCFEQSLNQSVEAAGIHADLSTTSLRGGLDIGTEFGVHAIAASLLGGLDFRRTEPKASDNPELAPTTPLKRVTPVLRLEVRYELTLGAVRLGAGVFADAPLADTHYDIEDATGRQRAAEPWRVRPGALLSIGLHTGVGRARSEE